MGKEKAVGPCHQSEECLTNKVASQRPVGSRVLRIRPLTDSVSVAGTEMTHPSLSHQNLKLNLKQSHCVLLQISSSSYSFFISQSQRWKSQIHKNREVREGSSYSKRLISVTTRTFSLTVHSWKAVLRPCVWVLAQSTQQSVTSQTAWGSLNTGEQLTWQASTEGQAIDV